MTKTHKGFLFGFLLLSMLTISSLGSFALAQTPTNPAPTNQVTIPADSPNWTCKINGEVVPCDQLKQSVKHFFGWGIGIVIFFFSFGVLALVFWIMMLVHAIKTPIEHKPLWILIILITGILGAVVYYFAVKKQPTHPTPPPQTPNSTPPGSTPTA